MRTLSTTSARTRSTSSGVETLVGGSGDDQLLFTNYFSVANVTIANVSASDGFDLTESSFNGTFRNINTLTGGAGADLLNGANIALTWTINATGNQVTDGAKTLAFSAIETVNGGNAADTFNISNTPIINLNGGAGDDVFNFAANANLTGVIDGQGGSDTFTYASFNASITVTLNSVGVTDGFNGTASALNGTFANVDSIIGSTATTDTLNGANLNTIWKFEVGSLKLEVGSNTFTFSAIEILNGGTER